MPAMRDRPPRQPHQTGRCPWCNAEVPDIEGPVHPYMTSSAGCWATFGEVLEREYSDPAYARFHRLTVDAYAVQHPGSGSPQPPPAAVRSVCLHLISLCAVLEHQVSPAAATRMLSRSSRQREAFTWLEPPASTGRVTVRDVHDAASAQEHEQRVMSWAESAWQAWERHHPTVQNWVAALLRS